MTRVLVVDDHKENVYYLRALLEAQGWLVDSACHGAEALSSATSTPPDLVISDLLMPVMDGYSLLKKWRADRRLKHIPFVVYTATYTDAEDERLAMSLGADGFILKPSTPDELLHQLRQALTKDTKGSSELVNPDETELAELYNQRLIHKLEQKTHQLELTNRSLESELEHRRQVELDLREQQALLSLAGRTARLGGWSVELPSLKIHWSDEVCEIHGVPPNTQPTLEEAMAFYPPEFQRLLSEAFDRCVTEGVPYDLDLQIVTTANRRMWVRGIGMAMRDSEGTITKIAGAFQDIDDRCKLEEQFRQAQKMEAVGHLAGGLAHDFNNILSVMLGYAELMLDALEPDAPMRDDIEEICRAGERGNALTRQLLSLSRGRPAGSPEVLLVSQVVTEMQTLLQQALSAQIDLTLITHFSNGKVLADPSQIEQVLMNLTINARDAMPNGGKLSVETVDLELDADYCTAHHNVTPGPYVMLAVTDTGTGMDAQTRARLFEPFFTTKERGKGTGLGLATVFGIVTQLRGHIWVYSELDRGTTFKIYLPRTDLPPDATAPRPRRTLTTLQGTEKVLLVEDDPSVRNVTSAILRRQGYDVLEAQNGAEAISLCEQFEDQIRLLITDIVMPQMGGRELVASLLPLNPNLRILYVSGYTENSILANGMLDGEIAFLAKPITPQALLSKVREVLDA